jgi:hypothetical protein
MATRWKKELQKQGGDSLIANGIVWSKCPYGTKTLKPCSYVAGSKYPFPFFRNENYRRTLGIAQLNRAAHHRIGYAKTPENYAYHDRSSHLTRAYLALADSVRMRLGLPLADDNTGGLKTDLVRDRVFLRHTFGLDPYFQMAAE